MPKASELKKGVVVEIGGAPHIVKQIEAKSPSARGASTLYKIRFINLKTGHKLDQSFRGDDFVRDADYVRARVQFSYIDGDSYVFMNTEDYSQYALDVNELEGQRDFLSEGLEGITALLMDGVLIGIELPGTVNLEIVQTAPAIKGATATGRTKPARLTTGVEVQVPEYLAPGEVIKVNTANSKFVSRA